MKSKSTRKGHKLLEIAMIDVLDGMEEAACYLGYQPSPDTLEILSIEAPGKQIHQHRQPRSEVIQLQMDIERSTDIVHYIVTRENRKIA